MEINIDINESDIKNSCKKYSRTRTLDILNNIFNNKINKILLTNQTLSVINNSRKNLENFLATDTIAYGINTGFGSLKDIKISQDDLELLQYNLIVSTAIGVGEPLEPNIVKGIIILKIINLSHGYSGVSLSLIYKLIEMFEKNFIPFIPKSGSLGASGDLIPLSHLILGLLGLGKAYNFDTNSWDDANIILNILKIEPIKLKAKEGLALINGTQFITTIATKCLIDSKNILKQTIIACSMCIVGLNANPEAFNIEIHDLKNHNGQLKVSKKLMKLLKKYKQHHKTIQDGYSLRCIPQILGPILDAITFSEKIIINEINSVSDNPLVFKDKILSGGNFHGLYISLEMDKLSICLSNLCNLIERLIDRCVNHYSNGFLPSFLIKNPGLNCGFMITQYLSASITAENRILAAPASIHNIPTCENIEDIVPMGGNAVNKCLKCIDNCYKLLAIFFFVVCQTLDFANRLESKIPNSEINIQSTYLPKKVNKIYKNIRQFIPSIENDCYMKEYIDLLEIKLKNCEINF